MNPAWAMILFLGSAGNTTYFATRDMCEAARTLVATDPQARAWCVLTGPETLRVAPDLPAGVGAAVTTGRGR